MPKENLWLRKKHGAHPADRAKNAGLCLGCCAFVHIAGQLISALHNA